ncbi:MULTISPECIES: Slp family lipoprotein [Enterobacter]|uniref:Slp family lipoprotein n=1 Tax=Enterobacter TaxID=547 RepID=UPI0013051A62|nr:MULTISPECIES: Slp family lipoprotein [Enterobacter]MDI3426460.1 Slp family lipoprotein [Enterobacter sp. V87_3]HDS6851280.1 Slp family lipoprotein [Enterobacter cancerogenus]
MTTKSVKKTIISFTLFSTLLLSGCSMIPDSLKGGEVAVSPATYEQLSLMPDMYKGQEVRLGGKVLNVINLPNRTIIELAVLPLNSYAQPKIQQSFQGRVLIYSDKFLDPDNFRNRYITVLGKMDGTENRLIGKRPYRFLNVGLISYQTWQLENTFMPNDGWVYAWSPEWGIAPPPGYFYSAPETVNENSYLEP